MAKMNVKSLITKDYRKNDCLAAQKTNPIKPNFRILPKVSGKLLLLIKGPGLICLWVSQSKP
jgi:hypothetical protein